MHTLSDAVARERTALGPSSSEPWCELDRGYRPQAFRVQWASGPWMNQQARALRRD